MFSSFQSELARTGTVSFYVRVRPGASKTQAKELLQDGSVKIAIAAPAERGKANAELTRFLAKEFGVAPTKVQIISGKTAPHKLLRITQ